MAVDFIHQKSFKRFMICDRAFYHDAMQSFLNDPDKYLASSCGPYFKSQPNDTTTIRVVTIGGKQ